MFPLLGLGSTLDEIEWTLMCNHELLYPNARWRMIHSVTFLILDGYDGFFTMFSFAVRTW